LPPSREILMVEDNPGDVRLVREALRDLKPEVTLRSAPDGDEALRILRRQGEHSGALRPRLILLDFNLPKSDSRAVLREIKTDAALRAIPVAVLTTSDAEKDIQEAYDLHANCYLRKPVDLDAFLTTIRSTAEFWLNVAQQGSD
jgi:chemotaxis family two-component system response regulator Rcp1